MSHSNIYILRIMSDSVQGDWLDYKEPWLQIDKEKLLEKGLPEWADYFEDVDYETQWSQEIGWLSSSLEGELKKIKDSYYIRFKIKKLKECLAAFNDRPIGKSFVLASAYYPTYYLTMHQWGEAVLGQFENIASEKGKREGPYKPYKLKDEDTFIVRVEGVVDYHF